MKLLHQIERINQLHQLIVKANTHKPCIMAKRLNISVSRLYVIIEELKSMGAPIDYCRTKCTYFYTYPYDINISICFKPLNAFEQINVNGGAIALGHPLGCTGAKLSIQLLYELQRRKQKYGLVTMCVGTGGAAGVFEYLGG